MHKLVPGKRYRSLAVLLLVLYGFIAVPVQWWHHHAEIHQTAGTWRHCSVVFQYEGQWAPACKICDHEYTAYYNTGQAPYHVYLHPLPVMQPNCGDGRVEALRLLFSNKGPPAARNAFHL